MRRRFGRLIALGLVVALLAGCGGGVAPTPGAPATPSGGTAASTSSAASPSKAAQLEQVKIGIVPIFEMIMVLAAKELGYFQAEGVDVELLQFQGGSEVTAAMLGRSIDIQTTTTDRPILLAEKGQKTKNLVSIIDRVAQTVIVRNDENVAYGDLKGLKGKKLGITTPGSGTDVYLRYYLKTAGLDPDKDVSIIGVGTPANMIAALQSKQVDGLNAIEPAASQALDVMKIAKPVLDVAKDGPGIFKAMPFLSLSATSQWIDSHPELAKKVIRAQVKANNDMRADPQKVVPVAKKYFEKIDPALAETILKKQSPYWVSVITPDEIKAAVQVNREVGLVTKDVTYEDVVVGQPMRDLWK